MPEPNSEHQPKEVESTPNPNANDKAVARMKKAAELFPQLLDDWELKHPLWHLEVLLWILDRGLKSLRGYIEADSESEITWDAPHVELHYPVECVWAGHSTAEEPAFHLQTGQLTFTDSMDANTEAQAVSRLVVRHVEIAALQDWTNKTAFEKRGERFQPVASAEDVDRLQAILDPAERTKAGNVLFSSAAFGAGSIDYGDMVDGEPISETVADQLAAIQPPLVYIPLEVEGHRVRVITILEVNPLIADAHMKKAYFPIVVGLAIQADDGEDVTEQWLEEPWARLSKWAEGDRKAIWELLHGQITASLDELGPKPEPEMEEAILTVNLGISVMVPRGDPEGRHRIIADKIAPIAATPGIVRLDISISGQRLSDSTVIARQHALVEQVESAESNDQKGKSLELLVAELFGSVSCFIVEERIRTETEEIDVWITNNDVSGSLRNEGEVILAECKNWTGKCGKNEFGSLWSKMMNRGGRCTLGFLISWNGFADTIPKEMLRVSKDRLLIVPLDGEFLRQAVATGEFFKMLTEARKQALRV